MDEKGGGAKNKYFVVFAASVILYLCEAFHYFKSRIKTIDFKSFIRLSPLQATLAIHSLGICGFDYWGTKKPQICNEDILLF